MKTELQVQKFTDYRAFLLAHAQDMKKQKPSWSYRCWAKTLGLSATSSITKIIQGQRHPGPLMTEKLIQYFRFRERDAQYFRDLVRLYKIRRDPKLSVLLMEKMGRQHPGGAIKILDDPTFSIVSGWYHFVIREMSRMDSFFEDPEWISKSLRFKATPREVGQAIQKLLQANMLIRDERGRLKVSDGRIHTGSGAASEAIKRYHEQMLENAKQGVRAIPMDEREFTSSVLVVRKENLSRAREAIREFKNKFVELFEETAGEAVYALQIQLYPVTKANPRLQQTNPITNPIIERNQNQ
ncbi:MAG: TIGR02147 family protein [Bdellovibrionota bacterium]